MFELSVACKYLIPRWRQLSVSIISIVSILVIALVVWLIVVFFSVKNGLENSWIDKIVALTAPVRITPTEKYYQSYYYLADTVSSESNYTAKSIGEKQHSSMTDPYDPNVDEEIPLSWPQQDLDSQNSLKDPVKEAFSIAVSLKGLKNLKVTDFEVTMAHLHLRLLRHSLTATSKSNQQSQQFMEHSAYIGSFDADTKTLATTLLPVTPADLNNLLSMQEISSDNIQEENSNEIHRLSQEKLHARLKQFFNAIDVTTLKTPSTHWHQGWRVPLSLFAHDSHFSVVAIIKNNEIARIIIPSDIKTIPLIIHQFDQEHVNAISSEVIIKDRQLTIETSQGVSKELSSWIPIVLESGAVLKAAIIKDSIQEAKRAGQIHFLIHAKIQNNILHGEVELASLEIADATINDHEAIALMARPAPLGKGITMPKELSLREFSGGGNSSLGESVLLPRVFQDAGALIGDHGYLSYYSPTPTTIQEQRIPIVVAGFYDPGIMSIGGKYILASKELTSLIRSSHNQEDVLASNGINVRFDNLDDASRVKNELLTAFAKQGISSYWNVQTFEEYDFAKDLIQQLHSEKNLFSLISLIVIIVACSNIISMLIILVNDKKLEIGILRSMGATSWSIAIIFGVCGMVMGTLGSLIGTGAAILTLHYVNELVALISQLQGHELFNPVFYGSVLPSEISFEALSFVIITTAGISLIAGIVPALKASMLRPSAILRAE